MYGFKDKGYLSVYQSALDLVENYNDKERAFFIYGQKNDWLRDIHAAVNGKGRRGYTKEMKDGIVEKCKELKVNLDKYKSLNDNLDLNNDEIDVDTEDDDNLPIMTSNKPLRRKRKISSSNSINGQNKKRKVDDSATSFI